jgi:multisubunit Na+/H+ antiporter MnhF subunit
MMSNKAYDVLKWIALVALDAIGVFYNTLSVIWGLPFGDQVLATCAALSLLLGALIGVSSAKYNKSNA